MTDPAHDASIRAPLDQHGLGATRVGPRTFTWGERTFAMGILNATPDSFSGDGLLVEPGDPLEAAVAVMSAVSEVLMRPRWAPDRAARGRR